MHTGKMTATWLILLTIAGCSAVPVLMIYFTTVHPFVQTQPAQMILILIDIVPQVLSMGLSNMPFS